MERNFKRISDGLKLPQESRERIRSQLASYQKQSEDIPMKKSTLKSRVPLIAVAVVMMMALTLTAAAAIVVANQFIPKAVAFVKNVLVHIEILRYNIFAHTSQFPDCHAVL